MTEDELQALLERTIPARDRYGLFVEECQDQDVRLRFPFQPALIGPGDIFSGPALLGFADTAIFAAILATSDGGEHWSVQRSSTEEDRPIFGLHMLDGNNGVAVDLWSLVLRTTDAGQHWEPVNLSAPPGASTCRNGRSMAWIGTSAAAA